MRDKRVKLKEVEAMSFPRRTVGLVAVLVLAALAAAIFPVYASPDAAGGHRVIVTFDHAVNEQARDSLEGMGGRVVKELPLVNGMVVVLPNEAAVDRAGTLAGVVRVEEDAFVYALHHRPGHDGGPGGDGGDDPAPPPAPDQVLPWGVDRIDAELAWTTSTGAGVKVAVVDTGIDLDHPDLNVVAGVDCTKGPSCDRGGDGDDDNGHGTHVAGTIAALDNAYGVVGVAPGAELYAVKVLSRTGSGFTSDVIEGIGWAVANGMDVINLSLGSSTDVQSMHDAVDAAYAAGVVVVAAAGNSGDGDGTTNEVAYPARYSSVIAVAATDQADGTPTWSSEGAEVEVSSPGLDVYSTWNDGGYNTISGTSMASPHTAGTVALMLGAGMTPTDARAALTATADDLGSAGRDNFYGYGLTDAEEATTGVQTSP